MTYKRIKLKNSDGIEARTWFYTEGCTPAVNYYQLKYVIERLNSKCLHFRGTLLNWRLRNNFWCETLLSCSMPGVLSYTMRNLMKLYSLQSSSSIQDNCAIIAHCFFSFQNVIIGTFSKYSRHLISKEKQGTLNRLQADGKAF